MHRVYSVIRKTLLSVGSGAELILSRLKKIIKHCYSARAGQRKHQPSAELRIKSLLDERIWAKARETMAEYLHE